MSKLLPLLALLLALFAGCTEPSVTCPPGTGPAPTAADCVPSPTMPPAAAPEVVSFVKENRTTKVQAFGNADTPESGNRINFRTDHNVTAILVELVWSDPIGASDLDAYLRAVDVPFSCGSDVLDPPCGVPPFYAAPDGAFWNTNGSQGFPDSPSRLNVTGDALRDVFDACANPCRWVAQPWAREAVADVTWSLNVTVIGGHVERI